MLEKDQLYYLLKLAKKYKKCCITKYFNYKITSFMGFKTFFNVSIYFTDGQCIDFIYDSVLERAYMLC